ncbi:MAG: hypothetical protein ACLFU2_14595 [Opitutales bacterium]
MQKKDVVEALISLLQEHLEASRRASEDAASYATDGEAKAREKWETQGLEASYLAAGQAGQAKSLAAALQRLRAEYASLIAPSMTADLGALAAIDFGGGTAEWYFLSPVGGGETVVVNDESCTVITPQSPLFAALRGAARGRTIRLANGASARVTAVG